MGDFKEYGEPSIIMDYQVFSLLKHNGIIKFDYEFVE